MTLNELARELNRAQRRHSGLTRYVYEENERSDVAALEKALREMDDVIITTLHDELV